MRNKSAITWGFVCSVTFGIITALFSKSDIVWLRDALTILGWPILYLSALIILNIFIDVDSSSGIFVAIHVIYMCFLGFFVGYYLNKLYLKMMRKGINPEPR